MAPYDRILVTAGASYVPPALFEQLCEGGILVIPVGTIEYQILRAIRKISGEPVATELSACRFVPLIGDHGWPEHSRVPDDFT
jgi:protein-L-isoaspartate(D-aspartate) O-methyltransferase